MKVNSKHVFIIIIFGVTFLLIGIFIGRLTFENTEDISDIPKNENTIPVETETTPPRIDLNTATVSELSKIPGLSHQLAAEIIAYRQEYGDYVDVDELLEVDGMNKTIYNEIVDYVKVVD